MGGGQAGGGGDEEEAAFIVPRVQQVETSRAGSLLRRLFAIHSVGCFLCQPVACS